MDKNDDDADHLDGLKTKFNANGQLVSLGNYENGQLHGYWSFWWDSGGLWMTGYYRHGKPIGCWRFYHENGVLWAKGKYKYGKEHGRWYWWHEDGTVDHHKTGMYEAGTRIGNLN